MSNNNDNEQLSDGDKSLIGLYMISRLRNGGGAEEVEKGAEQIKNLLKSQKQIYGMSSGDLFEHMCGQSNNINNINEVHNIQNYQNNTVQNGEEGNEKKKKKKKHRRKKKNNEQKKDNDIEIQEDKKEENNWLNKNVSGIDTTTNGNTKQKIDNYIYDDDFEEFQEEDKKEEEKKKENDDDKKTIDELLNYINKDNEKEKKKRKHKNKKGKKNEIKTEIHEEEKDEVVEEYKESLKEYAINNNEITKIKPCLSEEWIKSLDDTNKKNNNIEK